MGNPTGFHLTPGQAHDIEGADVLLKDTEAQAVLADKAYDAQARVIDSLLKAGKTVIRGCGLAQLMTAPSEFAFLTTKGLC